jgi:hypothetical protein
MSSERGILQDGPHHGRIINLQEGARNVIVVPYMPPFRPMIELPERRWWHRLLRRPAPMPPESPQYVNLIYRRTDETRNGNRVYRLEQQP